MKKTDLCWLAGWLEGEGTFYFAAAKSTFVIQVFSIDRDVIDRAAKLMCGAIYSIKPRGRSQGGYRIHLESQPAVNLAKALLPLMGARRTVQIGKALAAWENRVNRPMEKLCACGCGERVFGGPRMIYARRGTGRCAMRAFRARKSITPGAVTINWSVRR